MTITTALSKRIGCAPIINFYMGSIPLGIVSVNSANMTFNAISFEMAKEVFEKRLSFLDLPAEKIMPFNISEVVSIVD